MVRGLIVATGPLHSVLWRVGIDERSDGKSGNLPRAVGTTETESALCVVIVHVLDFDKDRITEEKHDQAKREQGEREDVEETTQVPAMGRVVPFCVDGMQVVIFLFCCCIRSQLILCCYRCLV